MLLVSGSYSEVCAAIVGFDHRDGAGVLAGFRAWMAARYPELSNFSFWTLVAAQVVPHRPDTDVRFLSPEHGQAATAILLDRLDEYLRG